jgi:ribosomal protein S12 methylthiotransferase
MTVQNHFVGHASHPEPLPEAKGRLNIITMGCDKNRVDSEKMAAQLQSAGFQVALDASRTQPITLINTCGFINDAKEESIEVILECIEEKKRGNIRLLIVFGCLSQRYLDELHAEIPEVDAWFGTDAIAPVLHLLRAEMQPQLQNHRLLSTPSHYAYLKISEGCNHGCAYCAIPLIRGRHRSKPIEQLLEEAHLLADKGVRELILVAQDLTSYGIDLYQRRELAVLLEELSRIPQLKWIRLHYAYPNRFPLEVLDVIRDHPQLCHYLDIPIQHIDDNVLKLMNRHITEKEIRQLLEIIRTRIPDMALRTTLMVGFPGETRKSFDNLCAFVKDFRFDRMGVFTYSHEEDTPAYTLKDNISQTEKERRKEELMWIQQEISLEKNREKVGKQFEVLIDSRQGDHFIGRTQYDSPEVDHLVLLNRKTNRCEIGNFYPVRITRAREFEINGKVITDNQPL